MFTVQAFKLPDIGEGIAEVQVMEWFVKEGDRVNEMDKLCLVESDKASVEITSRYSGLVKSIKVPAHEQAKVGSVILEIDDESIAGPEPQESVAEKTDAPHVVTKKAQPAPVTPPIQGKRSTEVKASPAVRALAKSLGLDLSSITGTGPDGRIVEQDIRGSTKPISKEDKYESSLDVYGPAKEVKLSQVGLAMVKSMMPLWECAPLSAAAASYLATIRLPKALRA